MKTWIFRLSIVFNVLVLVIGLGAWINRDLFVSAFLDRLYMARVSFFSSYPVHAGSIVMLGDSITEGGEWAEIFPGLPLVNRGIGGDTTTGVLARLDSLVEGHPRAIFLKIGTNDLTLVPEREISLRQYRDIITTIQSGSPETAIYVQSLLPRSGDYREEVEGYNLEIRSIADELGVEFIDLYPSFLAADGSIRDELTYDELHLSGDGYRLWQSLLGPVMDSYRDH